MQPPSIFFNSYHLGIILHQVTIIYYQLHIKRGEVVASPLHLYSWNLDVIYISNEPFIICLCQLRYDDVPDVIVILCVKLI